MITLCNSPNVHFASDYQQSRLLCRIQIFLGLSFFNTTGPCKLIIRETALCCALFQMYVRITQCVFCVISAQCGGYAVWQLIFQSKLVYVWCKFITEIDIYFVGFFVCVCLAVGMFMQAPLNYTVGLFYSHSQQQKPQQNGDILGRGFHNRMLNKIEFLKKNVLFVLFRLNKYINIYGLFSETGFRVGRRPTFLRDTSEMYPECTPDLEWDIIYSCLLLGLCYKCWHECALYPSSCELRCYQDTKPQLVSLPILCEKRQLWFGYIILLYCPC